MFIKKKDSPQLVDYGFTQRRQETLRFCVSLTPLREIFLLIGHAYHRHNHFFQANASVLEGIAVIIGEMIVVVGIAEIMISLGKDER